MTENIAQFRFNSYKILSSSIKVEDTDQLNPNIQVEFSGKNTIDHGNFKFRLELTSKIFNDNKSIDIEVVAVGFFEFDRNLSDELKNIFFQSNAPAILFPYVRAYIGTLTALSGISPVVLPTLNLSNNSET